MGKPKKHTSPRRTGYRRSGHVVALGRTVNAMLSHVGKKVRVYTTKRESAKKVKAA